MECTSNNFSRLSENNSDLICTFAALILFQDKKFQLRIGQFSHTAVA